MGEKMREGREEGKEERRLDDERKEEKGEKTRGEEDEVMVTVH